VTNLAIGFVLSLLIAAAAYRMRALSASGALGAMLIGTTTFGLGGWAWGLLLIAFFVSSSALSRLRKARKAALDDAFAKTGRRDLWQTLANGGWGAALAVAALGAPDRWPFFAAFVGAMAAVNADTWATELGVLGPRPPRLITSGRQVAAGTSGAISLHGTLAAAGGALFIGLAALALSPLEGSLPLALLAWLPAAALLGGLAGALADSLLGATVQGIYWCERDQKETEKRLHGCGERTRLLRGWAWVDNEWVNFACSVVGSVVAWGVWRLLASP
jgi:uncharacterized protein (TIGR00297 family)